MDKLKKVLVACPTFSGMKYCLSLFLDRIKNLSYPNYQILIVDNSLKEDYSKEIASAGVKCIWDNPPEKDKLKRLIHSRNLILDYAASNNFDYVLMMDQDVIPPKGIIELLLSSEKDIISGIYFNYFISSGKNKWLPVAWMSISSKEFVEMKAKGITFPSSVKSNKDLSRHLTEEEVSSGEVLKVLHPSAGCMLLSKRAFSNIGYESLDLKKLGFNIDRLTNDDLGFRKNAIDQGFEIFLDTKCKCEHLVMGKFILSGNELVHPLRLDQEKG